MQSAAAQQYELTWETPSGRRCVVVSHAAGKIKDQMIALMKRGITAACHKDGQFCGAITRLYVNSNAIFEGHLNGEKLQ